MNNKQTSPKKIWLALASAIANALACDETPAELADSLQELDNCLVELLTDHKYGHTIALLRGLTLDAQSGRSLVRQGEKGAHSQSWREEWRAESKASGRYAPRDKKRSYGPRRRFYQAWRRCR